MLLKDHLTVFILPFSFKEKQGVAVLDLLLKNSIWERSRIEIEDSLFFSHVAKYFKSDATTLIYDLKDSFIGIDEAKKDAAKVFKKNHFVEVKTGKLFFKFGMQKSTLSSPKLILFPLASVGLLTFTVQITYDEATTDDLMNLNYCLAKYDKSQIPDVNIVVNHEKEISSNAAALRALNQFGQESKQDNAWNFDQLSGFLLSDIEKNIKRNHSRRFHLFTYCQIDTSNVSTYDVKPDFMRIVRAQNAEYMPDIEDNSMIRQTFDEIFIGSSVESGGMMLNLKGRTNHILVNFKTNSLLSRYLWIYFLVYHQRILLINRIGEISKTDFTDSESSKDRMLDEVSELSKILVKTSFSDISDITQINSYYDFLSKNLKISNYVTDLKSKVKDIQSILQQRINNEDKQRALEEKRRAAKLEVILTLLLFPQVLFAFMAFISGYLGINSDFSLFQFFFGNKWLTAIIAISLLGFTMWCLFALFKLVIKDFKNITSVKIQSFFSSKIKRHWKWPKDS